jgi:hypothetical protein
MYWVRTPPLAPSECSHWAHVLKHIGNIDMQISNCYYMFLVVPYRIHVMITSQMFSTCIWQLHCKKFEPHPAMFSRCFRQFPGPLAPSERHLASKAAMMESAVAIWRLKNFEEKESDNAPWVENMLAWLVS